MLEPPNLAEARIIVAVREHYGLPATTLAFLPLGQDVAAWTYRVRAAGGDYFLKLRNGAPNQTGLQVPRHLADHGAGYAVAPLRTRTGELWCPADGFAVTLYPFIEGATGMARGMDERHWVAFGAALRELHATPVGPALAPFV
ncbi:MAG TPA: phosphotransferase, partial [Dehalococcoidia bacterium]|nr:phosphotransferase [Dehalococcoidia bacterium]